VNRLASPALAVILPTDRLATIAETLAAMRRQSGAETLEIVIVAPPAAAISPADVGDDFHSVRIVACDGIDGAHWLHRARAAGVRRATAPVVAIGETHSYPEPGWAAAHLAAHRDACAAVGTQMRNANPESVISWANLFVDFAPWVERAERGSVAAVPGHNTSYKRDVLLARGERLAEALASETLLAEELLAEGHELRFEPAAATRHLNLATPYWFLQRFDHDREWAALRGHDWRLPRRALYILAAPLIPFVRFARIHPDLRRAGRGGDLRLAAAVLLGLAAGAVGEAFGYASRRVGRSASRMHEVELHRERFAGRRREPRA
jgi:hypothetical protein